MFFCVHGAAATRGQYLALKKALVYFVCLLSVCRVDLVDAADVLVLSIFHGAESDCCSAVVYNARLSGDVCCDFFIVVCIMTGESQTLNLMLYHFAKY